ncbi:hypothetical protein TVAG_354820 [Trichomonas vaginalis G3]|uniref:Uncharacterized protein n=1 Tax=Trichomonas vaginalis (strain ATCC PRA-98 / G3) TaxID=412133 RepID=A2EFW7_TRIV3|nr:hypothetical protein TVAGG3_0516200 [Trichomonas vaginalis G3]EAY08423.1 hypothetical protein TVAG_354820 [Trichomonas vaginalis G3]KAI5518145.1 hypothetical protein TVAGG3_0516200 [Trichomonas vaginalis G3]|eukprot:XP_001320646.1 hypothetical protein [Trichomonas vaginalis G3]
METSQIDSDFKGTISWKSPRSGKTIKVEQIVEKKKEEDKEKYFIYYTSKKGLPKFKWVDSTEVTAIKQSHDSKKKKQKSSKDEIISSLHLKHGDRAFLFDTSEWEKENDTLIESKFKKPYVSLHNVDGQYDRHGSFCWYLKYSNGSAIRANNEIKQEDPSLFLKYIKAQPDKFVDPRTN